MYRALVRDKNVIGDACSTTDIRDYHRLPQTDESSVKTGLSASVYTSLNAEKVGRSAVLVTSRSVYIVYRMAGIIAQLTRSARERSLRKNYGANK